MKPHAGSARVTRATGELRARHEATLSAETSGRIQRFQVDVGARVRKGDVLVELDASTARIQVQQAQAARAAAEAAHKGAESDLRRARELARGDAASPAAVERAETVELQTAAALQQASAAVARRAGPAREAHAPRPVRRRHHRADEERRRVRGDDAAHAGPRARGPRLARGPRRRCRRRSWTSSRRAPSSPRTVSPSGKPFQARIRSVGAVVEPGTRTVDVRADPWAAPLKELRPGAIVEIALGGGASAADGLFLPAGAVQEGGTAAVRVDRRGASTLKRQPVKVRAARARAPSASCRGSAPTRSSSRRRGAGFADGARVRVLQ